MGKAGVCVRTWVYPLRLKIDATAVFFPVTETGRFRAVTTADFSTGNGRGLLDRCLRLGIIRLLMAGNAVRMWFLHHQTMVIPLPMPFKLNFDLPHALNLTRHSLLRIDGRDAGAFLQAQCMNDVRQLGDGQWQYNGWLSPQGRVLALFRLLRIDAESYALVLAGQSAPELAQALSRFVLRSKVGIRHDTDCHLNGYIAPPGLPPDAPAQSAVLSISDGTLSRVLSIEPSPAQADAEALDTWHRLDMAAGWPWLAPSQLDRWTPHMLSLQRLPAYSLNKGCYPGQEIVARTHYLGKSKRELRMLSGAELTIDQSVYAGQQSIGTLIDADDTQTYALAVVSIQAADMPWTTAAGIALQPA